METLEKKSTSMNVKKAVKKDSGNEQMIERWQIKDTPFTVITIEGKEHFGVMGEYRVTEGMKSRGEVEDELRCITWNRMIQVMMILDEIKSKDKDFSKKIKAKLNNKTK